MLTLQQLERRDTPSGGIDVVFNVPYQLGTLQGGEKFSDVGDWETKGTTAFVEYDVAGAPVWSATLDLGPGNNFFATALVKVDGTFAVGGYTNYQPIVATLDTDGQFQAIAFMPLPPPNPGAISYGQVTALAEDPVTRGVVAVAEVHNSSQESPAPPDGMVHGPLIEVSRFAPSLLPDPTFGENGNGAAYRAFLDDQDYSSPRGVTVHGDRSMTIGGYRGWNSDPAALNLDVNGNPT